jgi:methionyl-tRNA formyltransferase
LKQLPSDFLGPREAGQFSHDVGVVVSFGYFMTENLLDRLRLGAINLHPSLLPKVGDETGCHAV